MQLFKTPALAGALLTTLASVATAAGAVTPEASTVMVDMSTDAARQIQAFGIFAAGYVARPW